MHRTDTDPISTCILFSPLLNCYMKIPEHPFALVFSSSSRNFIFFSIFFIGFNIAVQTVGEYRDEMNDICVYW